MIPFEITNWESIDAVEVPGKRGIAYIKTRDYEQVIVRQIIYSADYESDHWCEKGHIGLCLEGELRIELKQGQWYELKKGMSFQVSDLLSSHKTKSLKGATIFIVDGPFLGNL